MQIKKLNEEINKLLKEEKDYTHARELGYSDDQDFKVGDKVRRIWDKRPGVITKQIAVDTYEVEFPEYGTNMARTDIYYANELKMFSESLQEKIDKLDTTIADEINQANPIEQEKRFKTDKYGYEITTGDYDYANSIKVEIIERSEISNGNNPDAEAETIETWYADGKPALRCAYSVILDGPYHPEIVEVLDKNALYNILISLATQSQIFDNPIK